MSNYNLIKLNKIFDDQINFHLDLIKEHMEEITKLQKKRLVKSEALFKSFIHNPLVGNELHIDEPEVIPKTYMGMDLQSTLDDQDLIWDRIRKSQLGEDTLQQDIKNEINNNNTPEILNTTYIQPIYKENNLLVPELNGFNPNFETDEIKATSLSDPSKIELIYTDPTLKTFDFDTTQIPADLKPYDLYQKQEPPKINALFKFNPIQKQSIIKNIFNQATENITKLSLVNDKYKNSFDVEVQNEADRLLNVYLQTH